jgi:hypothetical protein
MCRIHWLVVCAVLAVLASGCGTSPEKAASSANGGAGETAATSGADNTGKLEGPAAAVQEFLEALRTGNDERATKMLTAAAREKTATLNRNVTPPASDTARFTVGKVDYVNDDGARVVCAWTDLDEKGQPKTDEAVWVLRREQDGWRVAGVAAQIFPDEQPVQLNFEDPDDMSRKQQWVREEYRRRLEAGELQAKNSENPEKKVQR